MLLDPSHSLEEGNRRSREKVGEMSLITKSSSGC
jgi:hypothetical protein